MTTLRKIGICLALTVASTLTVSSSVAQTKVVVIPLEADAAAATVAQPAPVLVDGNGAVVGVIATLITDPLATLVSEQGYIFNVNRLTGEILPYSLSSALFGSSIFASNDCSGNELEVDAYVRGNTYTISPSATLQYAPNSPGATMDVVYNSIANFLAVCTPISGIVEVFSLVDNNAAITGVPESPITLPITIETR